MRGKAHGFAVTQITSGITPAYAGKRSTNRRKPRCRWDHPRLCGEKSAMSALADWTVGSPPPMRGKAVEFRGCDNLVGITPAYAGKRFRLFAWLRENGDHPRLCGEKIRRDGVIPPFLGSPPPMRGKGEDETIAAEDDRITPAYAGKRSEQI